MKFQPIPRATFLGFENTMLYTGTMACYRDLPSTTSIYASEGESAKTFHAEALGLVGGGTIGHDGKPDVRLQYTTRTHLSIDKAKHFILRD